MNCVFSLVIETGFVSYYGIKFKNQIKTYNLNFIYLTCKKRFLKFFETFTSQCIYHIDFIKPSCLFVCKIVFIAWFGKATNFSHNSSNVQSKNWFGYTNNTHNIWLHSWIFCQRIIIFYCYTTYITYCICCILCL